MFGQLLVFISNYLKNSQKQSGCQLYKDIPDELEALDDDLELYDLLDGGGGGGGGGSAVGSGAAVVKRAEPN